jgi:hypothetical protein
MQLELPALQTLAAAVVALASSVAVAQTQVETVVLV